MVVNPFENMKLGSAVREATTKTKPNTKAARTKATILPRLVIWRRVV